LTQRTILVADDDVRAGDLLARFLREQGYATVVLTAPQQVEPEVRRTQPDLLLLDVNLPGLDGLEVCQRVRRFSDVPIIMVSGRCGEVDRTLGLEMGADDYVCKPFSPREMAARVKALLRRAQGRFGGDGMAGNFRIDAAGQRIAWRGQWLPLTGQEFRLLRRLLVRPGHVFSRDDLQEPGDTASRSPAGRVIDSHMKNIRRKLEAGGVQDCAITSVYGVGYRLELEEEAVC
jgi:two-component system response regulator BaeR